jgi:hypothetical protein
MLRDQPIVKHQLEHELQLDQYGQPVGAPEVKEHTTSVQYVLEDLRKLTNSLSKSLRNLLWYGICAYGTMRLILWYYPHEDATAEFYYQQSFPLTAYAKCCTIGPG